ncbi:MAG: hypothetical protein SWK76_17125 [Actinomycetota bacterium]|nr:hypothetical protein [Actinomycetota bacterium]
MRHGYHRGHPTLIYEIKHADGSHEDIEVYADNKVPVFEEERPCVRCGRMPTEGGADACLGNIPGVTGACCGHGVYEGFVTFGAAWYKRRLIVRLWKLWREGRNRV